MKISPKGFIVPLLLALIALLILGGGTIAYKTVIPPVQYWFHEPTNFGECLQATHQDGFGLVGQNTCYWKGKKFMSQMEAQLEEQATVHGCSLILGNYWDDSKQLCLNIVCLNSLNNREKEYAKCEQKSASTTE